MQSNFTRAAILALALAVTPALAHASTSQLDQRLTQLSNQGSGEAAYHLGMMYHLGLDGVPKDQRKAFELFKVAAERGDPLGAYKYGCYFDGQGQGIVARDPKLAVKYKLIAAEAGYALAQEDVARHMIAARDKDSALRCLEAAAAQGSAMALMALGSLYSGVMPPGAAPFEVPTDVVKGWAYLLLSVRDIPEMNQAYQADLKKLPELQQRQISAFAASWRARPSALTASRGLERAYTLAGLPIPRD
jgi:TPR repeat protein